MNARKTSLYGMLLALAMVLSYVEAMIPINIGVPGVKLGLPNIVTVIGLYSIGALPTLVISFLRILLVSFMFGNTMTLAYSISGFALSFLTMLLMRKAGGFHRTVVSVSGGVMHNVGQLMAAVALLHSARQVFCMGQGGSMAAAKEICARFACITNKFRAVADSHMQIMAASLMTEQDVVLFVSYSGATRDLMETLRTAKANGAKIILITHYEDSPGAKLADIVLLCGAQESPLDSGSIPIKVALLYVAEVLVLRYTMDDPQNVMDAQDRTSEALAVKML